MAHIQYVCTDEGNAHNRMCIMMIWSEHIPCLRRLAVCTDFQMGNLNRWDYLEDLGIIILRLMFDV